jgi:hypothetical protein
VLKNGLLGTAAKRVGQFSDVACPLFFDKKKVCCGFEFKRLSCATGSFNRHIVSWLDGHF